MLRLLLFLGATVSAAALVLAAPARSSAPPVAALDSASRACLECHEMQLEHSHPLGVPVRLGVGLPSTPRGDVACNTCHQRPAGVDRHAQTGRGAALRRPPALLCRACHFEPARPGSVLAHGLYLGRAHLIPGAEAAPAPPTLLDRESQLCLSCHDGGMASTADVRVVASGGGVQNTRRTNWRTEHPVGVRYGAKRRDPGTHDLRLARTLPPEVRLFDGRVGCGSCHSVYSGIEQMLSVSNRGSGLCLTCHDR